MVPLTLMALPAVGVVAIAGKLAVVSTVVLSGRVMVRTTCDGGNGVALLRRLAGRL